MRRIRAALASLFPNAGPAAPLHPGGIPESVKDLARERPFLAKHPRSPFPLRCADGRTFAERKEQAA